MDIARMLALTLELLPGIIVLVTLALVTGITLGIASNKYIANNADILEQVNRLLPQTQCAQCSYPGCKPYAEAILKGEEINRCPPGGEETISLLADLLGRERKPLSDIAGGSVNAVAVIREEECIGCTLCIQACPVDAIIGAAQRMHSVLTEECTGCDLCLEPCPVDCIDMIPHTNAAIGLTITDIDQDTVQRMVQPIAQSIAQPCINCGECETVCPRELAPQELLWFRDSLSSLNTLNIIDCIECRLCDKVCPSEIGLTRIFNHSKLMFRTREAEEKRAINLEDKYHQHERRRTRTIVQTRLDKSARGSLLDSIRTNPNGNNQREV